MVVSWTISRKRVDGTPSARRRAPQALPARGGARRARPVRDGLARRASWGGTSWRRSRPTRPPLPSSPAIPSAGWIGRTCGSTALRLRGHRDRLHRALQRALGPRPRGRTSRRPQSPRALAAAPGEREVRLTWQPPPGLIDGGPPRGDLRYILLRGEGAEGPLVPVMSEPVRPPRITDTGLQNETTTAMSSARYGRNARRRPTASPRRWRRRRPWTARRPRRRPSSSRCPRNRGAAGVDGKPGRRRGRLRHLSRRRGRAPSRASPPRPP